MQKRWPRWGLFPAVQKQAAILNLLRQKGRHWHAKRIKCKLAVNGRLRSQAAPERPSGSFARQAASFGAFTSLERIRACKACCKGAGPKQSHLKDRNACDLPVITSRLQTKKQNVVDFQSSRTFLALGSISTSRHADMRCTKHCWPHSEGRAPNWTANPSCISSFLD